MKRLLLFVLISSACFARIGETYDQCVARYGQPLKKVSSNTYTFKKSGVFVRVYLGPKGVGRIEYAKEKTGDYVRDALGHETIIGLLKVNSATAMQEERPGVGVTQFWANQDRSVMAYLLSTYPETLQIESTAYSKWEQAEAARKAAQALPGL